MFPGKGTSVSSIRDQKQVVSFRYKAAVYFSTLLHKKMSTVIWNECFG